MHKAGFTGGRLPAFRKRLLAWYARHKRAMPWRGTRDAYRIWVAEIMLQQTRVAAVLPYYQRFLRRFPTVRRLASARSEEVLKLWAGLGYYSRARNLHRAAKQIVARHNGRFPREYAEALALPGVGRYTAAAVLSIAYGEPLAVVDGNVARVMARLGAVRGALRAVGRWKRLEERAQELMPGRASGEWRVASGERRAGLKAAPTEQRKAKIKKREKNLTSVPTKTVGTGRELQGMLNAGEWNQAMMELGATVCTPRAPRCGECPVARWCRAYNLGIAEQLPAKRRKRATEKISIAAAVLLDARGQTLLVKPEEKGLDGVFSRMWQFPAVEVRKDARAELRRYLRGMPRGKQKQNELEPQMNADKHRCEIKRAKDLTRRAQRATESAEKNGGSRNWVELHRVRHSVTHREITLVPYVVRVKKLPKANGARMVPLAKLERLPVSNATRKIARAVAQSLSGPEASGRGPSASLRTS